MEVVPISLLKRTTLWLSIISILICLSDYLGSALANILLIRFNPLIDSIKFTEPFTNWIVDAGNTKWVTNSALIPLHFPAYLIHFGSFFFAGLVADYLIHILRRKAVTE